MAEIIPEVSGEDLVKKKYFISDLGKTYKVEMKVKDHLYISILKELIAAIKSK